MFISAAGNLQYLLINAAFLPSSLAMYATASMLASSLEPISRKSVTQAITSCAIGSILGWPFSAVTILPYFMTILFDTKLNFLKIRNLLRKGLMLASLLVAVIFIGDSIIFRSLRFVPYNIIAYNIFNKEGGPNLYGTEIWSFYFKNLALNFNFILPAAIAAPLLQIVYAIALTYPRYAVTSRKPKFKIGL